MSSPREQLKSVVASMLHEHKPTGECWPWCVLCKLQPILDAMKQEELIAGLQAAQQTVDAIRDVLNELQLEIDTAKVQP